MSELPISVKQMDNIVLDTNALLVAISAKSRNHLVWKAFLSGKYTLCVSNEILTEYEEVLARHLSPMIAQAVIYAIITRQNTRRVHPTFRFNLITSDPDNNKFVDCAITGNARYIVTEDHRFNVLKQISFPLVPIIGIDQFSAELAPN